MNIFDGDRRVVHQDANRQRQTTERHGIHGLSHRAQHNDRAENRERNGDRNDHSAPPTAQEEQNHQRGQARRNDSFAQDAHNGGFDKDRLIEELRDLQSLRCSSA